MGNRGDKVYGAPPHVRDRWRTSMGKLAHSSVGRCLTTALALFCGGKGHWFSGAVNVFQSWIGILAVAATPGHAVRAAWGKAFLRMHVPRKQ
eukprot:191018-Pyramimonas_sp.AAC.1